MYHSWLDRWDERRSQQSDAVKQASKFALDAEICFPDTKEITSIADFCHFSERAVEEPSFFSEPDDSSQGFETDGGWLRFPSDLETDIKENNLVWSRITDGGDHEKALIVFHHWNAGSRQRQLANFFSKRGVTVVEISLPYHFERSRPGSYYADYMLSPSLGRTLQSMRQAVLDGRKLIRWLKCQGYKEVSVLGMSLGSWVAGLVAAHDTSVARASLFLTAGSLADMVWTGRATRLIRQTLEPEIALPDLRRAWGPLDLENYAPRLVRPDLNLQLVLAKRDQVVLPQLSEQLLKALRTAGATPDVLRLNCGHYSLAKPPYIMFAGLRLKRLLAQK